MPEVLDEAAQLESTTVGVYRTAATVKGGRRFSFGALVVVGDRRGRVGYGHGKAPEVPGAIEKAQKYARRAMVTVPLRGRTLPHEVEGRFGATRVKLLPASPGTGVIAGATVRAVLELAGVADCLTKCYGSTTAVNVVKAVFDGLSQLRTPEQVAELRGVPLEPTVIDVKIERAERYLSEARETAAAARSAADRSAARAAEQSGRPDAERDAVEPDPSSAEGTGHDDS